MKKYNFITKNFLIKEYKQKKKSSLRIAKVLKCSHATVCNKLKKYNIPRRTPNELQKGKNRYNLSKDFLVKEYINNKKTAEQIAKQVGCSQLTVLRHLRNYNIKVRNNSESQIKHGKTIKKYYCIDCGIEIWYTAKRCKSCAQIGDLNNMFRVQLFGELNGNWNNGSSFEPYPQEFTSLLKLKIRTRDDFTCQKCNITEEEHIIVYGKVLTVHHIDYNKENCKEENLITVCNECNLRVNCNKKYWIEFFQNKIKVTIKKGE